MYAKNYKYRFEIKPGRFIYLPTKEARTVGKEIRKNVLASWRPDPIFFHLSKVGGHVSAMQYHKSSQLFAGTDIRDFFGSVSRTKVYRSLVKVGFSEKSAFDMASTSVVAVEGRRFLPYGFLQSMALATLALEKSGLGAALKLIAASPIKVSVFVDDIVLSGDDCSLISDAVAALEAAASNSGFTLCSKDSAAIALQVKTFNCRLSNSRVSLLPERMERFEQQYLDGNDCAKAAIIRYIRAINPNQADEFLLSMTL